MTTDNRGDDFKPDPSDLTEEDRAQLELIEAANGGSDADKAEAAEDKAVADGLKNKDAADDDKDGDKADDDKGLAAAKGGDEPKADDPKDTSKEPKIPLSRHKQILEDERARTVAAENLARALQAGGKDEARAKAEAEDAKIDELDAKYQKHVLDGELKEAADVMKQVRMLERERADKRTEVAVERARLAAAEDMRFEQVLKEVYAEFPMLDVDNPKFDEDVMKEVMDLVDSFKARGYMPSVSVQRAVKYVMPIRTAAQREAVDVKDVKIDPATPPTGERKGKAVVVAIDAAKRTPPNTANIGTDSDKAGGGTVDAKAVLKMNQDDFKKLGDEDVRRLRGDAL